jgi:uncharacterized cupredoxin-like copper-binding protein
MNAPRVSVAILAVAALAATACGDDDESGGSATGTATEEATKPTAPAQTTVKVRETEFKLDPANPRVDEPGTVQFEVTNDGKAVHALEVEGPKGEVETAQIQPGKSATLKADLSEPGTYVWYCPVGNHRELGMEGEITVAGGGAGGTSTSGDEKTKEDDSGTGGPGY